MLLFQGKGLEYYSVNAETQTEIHPVESFIDPSYSWDVWELKRKAVQLADICKRKTHSTQTHKSHMRLSVGCQIRPPKDKTTQTMTDNKTIMPKLQNYIFGLRGRSDNLAHTAKLTRPVDEWLYDEGARIMYGPPGKVMKDKKASGHVRVSESEESRFSTQKEISGQYNKMFPHLYMSCSEEMGLTVDVLFKRSDPRTTLPQTLPLLQKMDNQASVELFLDLNNSTEA